MGVGDEQLFDEVLVLVVVAVLTCARRGAVPVVGRAAAPSHSPGATGSPTTSSVIRSSSARSIWLSTISLRRASPNCSRISTNSSLITFHQAIGLEDIKQIDLSSISWNSLMILSCSRPGQFADADRESAPGSRSGDSPSRSGRIPGPGLPGARHRRRRAPASRPPRPTPRPRSTRRFLPPAEARRGLDQRDHLVDVGQRDRQAFEDMGALARPCAVEQGAPGRLRGGDAGSTRATP